MCLAASIYMSLSAYVLVCLHICLYVCLCMYLSVYLSVDLCICLSVCLYVCLHICMPVYISTCLSVYVYIFISVCWTVCLQIDHISQSILFIFLPPKCFPLAHFLSNNFFLLSIFLYPQQSSSLSFLIFQLFLIICFKI